MIKLSEITMKEVMETNIFKERFPQNGEALEVIDFLICINCKIDVDDEAIKEYGLSEEDLDNESLSHEFLPYLRMSLSGDSYKIIDKIPYNEIDYMICSEVVPEIEGLNIELSDEEYKKAYELLKAHIKSDTFKDALKRELESKNS